jgi:hypothetical protein
MRRVRQAALPLLLATTVLGCGGERDFECHQLERAFDVTNLESDIGYLASEELQGRAPGTEGDLAARAYIIERFLALGVQPGVDGSFEQPFVNEEGLDVANIVGMIPGTDDLVSNEVIVVGSHYDHFGEMRGKMYLGANDDASGVAGMLATAEAVAQQGVRRTVAFAAFGSEEVLSKAPFVEGSHFYVTHPPAGLPIDQTVYMVNLDMIGSYHDSMVVEVMGSFANTPAHDIVACSAMRYPNMTFELGVPGSRGASDFYPFCKEGIPYAFFWTDDYDCYHEPCDKAWRVDYAPTKKIVNVAIDLVVALGNSRDDLLGDRNETRCGH